MDEWMDGFDKLPKVVTVFFKRAVPQQPLHFIGQCSQGQTTAKNVYGKLGVSIPPLGLAQSLHACQDLCLRPSIRVCVSSAASSLCLRLLGTIITTSSVSVCHGGG